ncbi:MAG: hypothetical protein INR65_15250, partial [Gluconacetobacter diazotrophicus]|nr:hypothetical protein [Gluconacetobacter diazotrophicus]
MMMPPPATLDALRGILDQETAGQAHLADIRRFNHSMVGELGKCCPLEGCSLLDLGASVHGYALEAALERGV